MRAPSGTFSDSSLPLTLVSANAGKRTAPPPAGTSATFEDVLQQERGASSNPSDLKGQAPNSANNVCNQSTFSLAVVANEKIQTPNPSTATLITSLTDAAAKIT